MELRLKVHFRDGTNQLNVATMHASNYNNPTLSMGNALDDAVRALRKKIGKPIFVTEIEIVGSVEIK